jgi:hypothetical protein
MPLGIHWCNTAECAIQTFKNHFIASLCNTHPNFPLHLWDKLLPQALLSLNLLHSSHINPKLSTWVQLHGHFDLNHMPIGPWAPMSSPMSNWRPTSPLEPMDLMLGI